MKTKILMLILLLSSSPLVVSTSSKQGDHSANKTITIELHNTKSLGADKNSNATTQWGSLWQLNCPISSTDHNSGDDNKSHCIHFDRYSESKRRIIYCFMGKIILIVSHICSILSMYMHM